MCKKAFTLIEVLVVLVIIGLMMGLVIPQAGRIFRSNLKLASNNLAGAIKYAYDNSIMTRRIERIVFDFEKHSYSLEVSAPGVLVALDKEQTDNKKEEDDDDQKNKTKTFSRIDGTWGRIKYLPTGVFFDSIYDYSIKKEMKKDLAYMYFFPQGQTQSLIIRLKGNKSGFYSIKVNPISGISSIEGRYIEE